MREDQKNASRTTAATKNLFIGAVGKIVLLGATFLVRTLFIRILGVEYTGISSLYTNILSFLSLAELGMGSVLIFELYRPLQEKDEETINIYVALFQKIYFGVICAVLGVGLCLLPFLQVITNSSLDQWHLIGYYLLYLADSVCSYFVVYRTTVIEADQKRYITQTVDIATKLVMYICQSIYLVLYKDFVGYLCIQVLFTIVKNLILHRIATCMYPYLKTKPTQKLEKEKVRAVFKNVRATFISKVSNVVLTQTDSIIISMMLGVAAVGYYTNYNMIVVYINSIYYILYSALEASVGNLNAEQNLEKSFSMYKKLSLGFAVLNAFCVAEYLCLIQDFITVWIGAKYLQSMVLVVAILFSLYVSQAMNVVSMYRQTLGLFREVQKIYPLMATINIVVSVVLVKLIGVAGVPLGTAIARLFTTFWFEGALVFRKLGHSILLYLKEQFQFFVLTLAVCISAYLLCELVPLQGILALPAKGVLTAAVVGLFAWVGFGRSEEWGECVLFLKKHLLSKNG